MMSRLAVALGLSAAVLAGCGTTVPLSDQQALTDKGNGLSVGSGGTPAPGTADLGSTGETQPLQGLTGGTTGADAGSGAAPNASTTSAPAGGDPRPSAGAGLGPQGTAPGVTQSAIKIGVFTAQGFGDAAAALGVSVATGNMQAEAKAVIDYINSHGGVAGRRIIPVFYDQSVSGTASSPDNEYTRACAAWTEDDRVYAVVSPVGTVSDTLYDCLSKKGVPVIAAGDAQDTSFFTKYADFYYQPTDLNLRRILTNLADGLVDAKFFGASAKIGVIRADNNNEASAVKNGLEPALARHGLKITVNFAVSPSASSSNYQAAVLRMRSEGVTHILFGNLVSPLLFMIAADNQSYTPRYGLHSRNSPGALLQGSAPARQQKGAMGIGWQPMNDVDQARDPGILNARQKLCLDLMKQSGQASNGRTALLLGLWMCDDLLFLQDAAKVAPSWSMAGLRAGVESLGAFPSASTFRSRTGPGLLHDGAAQYRLLAFNDSCSCYRYTSPLKTAS